MMWMGTVKTFFCSVIVLLSACATQNSAAPVEDVTWRLTQVGSTTVRSDNPPTLRLSRTDKRATGNLGCNRFSGPYELEGETIRFQQLLSTKMACPQLPLETEYTRALEAARSWKIVAGNLELYDQNGPLLARLTPQ